MFTVWISISRSDGLGPGLLATLHQLNQSNFLPRSAIQHHRGVCSSTFHSLPQTAVIKTLCFLKLVLIKQQQLCEPINALVRKIDQQTELLAVQC